MASEKRSLSKYKYYAILVVVLAVLLFFASLFLEKAPVDIAKSDWKVRQFLEEAPNATVTVTNFEKTGFEEISEKIKNDCNNQNLQAKNYFKVKFFDENSGRELVVWIDWEGKSIECVAEQQAMQAGQGDSQNPLEIPNECQAGWKCKGTSHKALQNSDCSWKSETACEFGCSAGECLQDTCKGIDCNSSCDGNRLKFNGKCEKGKCVFETKTCASGCANAACRQAPCKTDCNDYCANNVRHYNGECADGNCVYSTVQCQHGCIGILCKGDPCANIICAADKKCVSGSCVLKSCSERQGAICSTGQTCSSSVATASDTTNCCIGTCSTNPCTGITCPDSCEGSTRKYNGQCSNGTCQYSTLQCQNGCENGMCKGDPCVGVSCPSFCEGNTRKYNGSCSSGQCQYSTEQCSYLCQSGACVADPCAGISCPDTCEGSARKFSGSCSNGTCQYSTEACGLGCSGGACRTAQTYGCNYVWHQEITNAQTGEMLLKCPSDNRPFCRAGFPQCCFYTDAVAEHYNCADCLTGNCAPSSACESVSCLNYCEGNTRKHLGVCRNGGCEYSSENCPISCAGGKCVIPIGVIFSTSQEFSKGNLGGISGADAKCQAAATSAGLSGTWIAIISDSTTNAKDRIPDTVYKLLNGTVIANNKADLFDGSISTTISVTETGGWPPTGSMWTGTNADGTASPNNCINWTSTAGDPLGKLGDTHYTDGKWIARAQGYCSSMNAGLYCIKTAN